MPPHQHGAHAVTRRCAHARPPAHQPLRNARALGLWHEPPRIRRRRRRGLAVLAVITALLAVTGWTFTPRTAEPASRVMAAHSVRLRVDLTPLFVIPCAADDGGAVVAGSLNPSDYNGSSSCRGSDRQ